MACDQKAANIWTARVIPVILLGVFGYGSWVVTKRLCIDYLINPPPSALVSPRIGSAVAILVIYYVLLIAVLVSYARLIQTILFKPGFLPYGPQWFAQHETDRASNANGLAYHGDRDALPREKKTRDDSSGSTANAPSSRDLEAGFNNNLGIEYWQKDIFICNYDGRPSWCNACMNFKPDRTHHCREVNRCVMKMDHFCPWVGGIVSETSLKFFIQFVAYTALFTIHCLISMAIFVAEQKRKTGVLDVHKILGVALAGLFLLFSGGMTASTVQMAMINVTTVENLTRHTKVWYIAVLIPRPEVGPPNGESPKFMTITYPRPPEEQMILQAHGGSVPKEANSTNSSPSKPQSDLSSRARSHYIPPRTFAILQTQKGENPFDLGPLENLKQVMGYSYMDWFLPFKRSPCADHSDPVSAYKIGDAIRRCQIRAGLLPDKNQEMSSQHHESTDGEEVEKKGKRRRHRRQHSQNHGHTRKKRSRGA